MSPSTPPPIILTRSPPDNAELALRLRARGLSVLEWPALATRILPPRDGAGSVAEHVSRAEVIVLTSRRGIEAAEESLELPDGPGSLGGLGRPCRLADAFAGRRVACIGPATAASAEARGLTPSWTASGSGSAELAALLARACPAGTRALLLRSAAADDSLPRALTDAGLVVEDLRLYAPIEMDRPATEPIPVAAVVCASPSAARQLLAWHPWIADAAFVAIGATTARALAELGVARVHVARGSDPSALEEAVLNLAMPCPALPETSA